MQQVARRAGDNERTWTFVNDLCFLSNFYFMKEANISEISQHKPNVNIVSFKKKMLLIVFLGTTKIVKKSLFNENLKIPSLQSNKNRSKSIYVLRLGVYLVKNFVRAESDGDKAKWARERQRS